MTIEARYRTLDGDTIGENVLTLTTADLDQLITITTHHAPFGITLRPTDTTTIDSELVAGIRDGRGALYYTDPNGAWYTHGPTPKEGDGPVYAEVDFPDHSELPATLITTALSEYLTTGARPTSVEWQDDPYAV
ncbi:Imm1 family immunity protein [Actinokineospora sp. HUAS TT18]|uniref:Imm1 family immunity protein n=1 Tax=Actinokineospora sp. HUAS TT18 TaxID=3447451 RepID=UPI003F51F3C2